MPPFADVFGELERLLGALYPYRVPIGLVTLIVIGLIGWQLQKRGAHTVVVRWASGHRATSLVAVVVLLAVAVPLANYTLSPLWEREVLHEPSPFEAASAGAMAPQAVAPETMAPTAAAPAPSMIDPTSTAPAAAPVTTAATTPPTPSPPTPSPPTATPTLTSTPPPPAAGTPRVVREGSLSGADAFHFGRGRVLLIDTGGGSRVLRFEGLSVRNGPDLFVYLSPATSSVGAAANLGALKATDGDFNYEVPANIEAASLANALIWCRQFGVLFASAALAPTP